MLILDPGEIDILMPYLVIDAHLRTPSSLTECHCPGGLPWSSLPGHRIGDEIADTLDGLDDEAVRQVREARCCVAAPVAVQFSDLGMSSPVISFRLATVCRAAPAPAPCANTPRSRVGGANAVERHRAERRQDARLYDVDLPGGRIHRPKPGSALSHRIVSLSPGLLSRAAQAGRPTQAGCSARHRPGECVRSGRLTIANSCIIYDT